MNMLGYESYIVCYLFSPLHQPEQRIDFSRPAFARCELPWGSPDWRDNRGGRGSQWEGWKKSMEGGRGYMTDDKGQQHEQSKGTICANRARGVTSMRPEVANACANAHDPSSSKRLINSCRFHSCCGLGRDCSGEIRVIPPDKG